MLGIRRSPVNCIIVMFDLKLPSFDTVVHNPLESFCQHGVLASEGWWEAWQPSAKVTKSY